MEDHDVLLADEQHEVAQSFEAIQPRETAETRAPFEPPTLVRYALLPNMTGFSGYLPFP